MRLTAICLAGDGARKAAHGGRGAVYRLAGSVPATWRPPVLSVGGGD